MSFLESVARSRALKWQLIHLFTRVLGSPAILGDDYLFADC